MAEVTICTIYCECEKGTMFKTALRNDDGQPAMFAIIRGMTETDLLRYTAVVFDGFCSGCGKKFQFSFWLENQLHYKEV